MQVQPDANSFGTISIHPTQESRFLYILPRSHDFYTSYPGVTGKQRLVHDFYTSYAGVTGKQRQVHDFYTSYPGVTGKQRLVHDFYTSYPGVTGKQRLVHDFYTSYPGVTGKQRLVHACQASIGAAPILVLRGHVSTAVWFLSKSSTLASLLGTFQTFNRAV